MQGGELRNGVSAAGASRVQGHTRGGLMVTGVIWEEVKAAGEDNRRNSVLVSEDRGCRAAGRDGASRRLLVFFSVVRRPT